MSPASWPQGTCPCLPGGGQQGMPDLPRRAARPSNTSIGCMGWFFLSTQNSLKINWSALAHMNISHCLLNKHKETLSELMGYFSFLGRQSNTQMESHLFYETPTAALLLWHKADCRCSQDTCDLSLLLVLQTHIFCDNLVTSFKSQTPIFNSEKIRLVIFGALCCCAPTMNVLIPCTYSAYTLP